VLRLHRGPGSSMIRCTVVSYLLKIDAILICIGCGVTIGDVDGNVVVVAVGEVDVITVTAVGIRSRS